jgi:hypothetical protein
MEHHDLADVGFFEVHANAIHENPLPDFQRRFHRAARNPVGLDDERLYGERQTDRHQYDHDELDDRVGL